MPMVRMMMMLTVEMVGLVVMVVLVMRLMVVTVGHHQHSAADRLHFTKSQIDNPSPSVSTGNETADDDDDDDLSTGLPAKMIFLLRSTSKVVKSSDTLTHTRT